jgi:hypothetical protein
MTLKSRLKKLEAAYQLRAAMDAKRPNCVRSEVLSDVEMEAFYAALGAAAAAGPPFPDEPPPGTPECLRSEWAILPALYEVGRVYAERAAEAQRGNVK